MNNLPATSKEEGATPKQIELLKENGLWTEGLSKDEASKLIDKIVGSGGNAPPPGIHLFKFAKLEELKDFNNNPKFDGRGYPGLLITFKCQHPTDKNDDGTPKLCKVSDSFYYSTLPIDHPDRSDATKKCASEWKLVKLKKACGWGQSQVSTEDMAKTAFYGVISKGIHYNKETGEQITNEDGSEKYSLKLQADYFVYNPSAANKGKPMIEGDPANGPIGGVFVHEIKVTPRSENSSSNNDAAAAASSSQSVPTEKKTEPTDSTDF